MDETFRPETLPVIKMIRRRTSGEWFSSEFGWSQTLAGATAFTSVAHMTIDPEWQVVEFAPMPF